MPEVVEEQILGEIRKDSDQIDSKAKVVEDIEEEVKTECAEFEFIIGCAKREQVLFDEEKDKPPKEADNDYEDMKHLLWDGPEDSDEEVECMLEHKNPWEIKNGVRFSKRGLIEYIEKFI